MASMLMTVRSGRAGVLAPQNDAEDWLQALTPFIYAANLPPPESEGEVMVLRAHHANISHSRSQSLQQDFT